SPAASSAWTSDTPPYTTRPLLARGDRTSRWARQPARARAWSPRTLGTPADAIDTRSPPVGSAESRSLDDETARDRLPIEAHGSRYTGRASEPRPHRLLPPGGECEYAPDGPVDPHDGAAPGGAVVVGFAAGRSTADVRSCGGAGAAAPVTRGFFSVMFSPLPPRAIAAIQAPEYRPALRVGSAPRGRMIMPLVCPWRQGTADRGVTTRLKFSQPEWIHSDKGVRRRRISSPAAFLMIVSEMSANAFRIR